MGPDELRRVLAWLRSNLLVLIFGAMLILQFMTWRALEDLRRYMPGDPPACDTYHPCTVELSQDSIDQVGRSVAGHR
jgi:hypothetical protein